MIIYFFKDNSGFLVWTENWISFLDTILQFKILNNGKRTLYLPTGLEYAALNPKLMTEYCNKNLKAIEKG